MGLAAQECLLRALGSRVSLGKQVLQAPESVVLLFQLLALCQGALPDTPPQHTVSSVWSRYGCSEALIFTALEAVDPGEWSW